MLWDVVIELEAGGDNEKVVHDVSGFSFDHCCDRRRERRGEISERETERQTGRGHQFYCVS